MNAITFIKQHGVEKAKKILGNAGLLHKSYTPTGGLYHRYEMTGTVSLTELKRLVESVDLVNDHGGLEVIKKCVEKTIFPLSDRIIRIKQAIADYESIYGGEHV
ncbi:hypothetical protein ACINWC323_2683 [Acinetobacter sp. WC-323]|uniref:hypothetical protein n=1 Tax=Acinetobacter sp. WC-323 TaxID=903918 RepID=UPI00029E4A5C|nr:hypothetical protein [Acinetobacter sp. WC-323]EKU56514.1 hypothetical protein ACINWC323_2683 [Acinetobacter sp. WC-323]